MEKTIRKLKWVVEFEVSENWVADGFEFTDELAQDTIEKILGYAYESEVSGKVISAPKPSVIAKIQGYEVAQ